LSSGAQVSRGSLLGRIEQTNHELVELRSPLIGKVDRILVANGSSLSTGAAVLTIKPDEQSIWEALRALSVVGEETDLPLIERYARGDEPVSDRTKQQAALTVNAIKSRSQTK
jgi:hypothetical protein